MGGTHDRTVGGLPAWLYPLWLNGTIKGRELPAFLFVGPVYLE
jgi:hypothetical protein